MIFLLRKCQVNQVLYLLLGKMEPLRQCPGNGLQLLILDVKICPAHLQQQYRGRQMHDMGIIRRLVLRPYLFLDKGCNRPEHRQLWAR